MRKETVATALIFLAVGFLAGYITDAQLHWSGAQRTTMGSAPPADMPGGGSPASANAGGGAPPALPEGHPPIDSAAVVKQLQDMAAQNPKDPEIRLKLANYLYDQKDFQQAIEWYQRALELDPANVNARTDLGTAFFYSGRPQDALREYHKSLQTNPKHEPTLVNVVIVNLEGTHDLKAAQEAWNRLQQLNPSHPALGGLKQKLDAARASSGGTTK